MPVLPSSAYVSVESVFNLARAIINDQIYSPAGEILTDTSNSIFFLTNDALEWLIAELNNHGVDTFTKETVLTPILPNLTNDPGIQVNVSDTGYFDGQISHAQPTVPTDLETPTFIWERQTGSTEDWLEMLEQPDGLPSIAQGSRLGIWEWRQDGIYMPGATQSNDLRLRYTASHPQFVTPSDTLFIRNGTGALAYKMVSTYLASKNPQAAAAAADEAKMRTSQICNRSARMKQRETTTRIRYGSPGQGNTFIPPRNS